MNAVISPCQRYRYELRRLIRPVGTAGSGKQVCFIMLNPSTADHEKDDPTIRRCKSFADSWGYGELVVVNLFAFRTAYPRELRKAFLEGVDVVGPENDSYIRAAAADASKVVCAWGPGGRLGQRALQVRGMLGKHPGCIDPYYLRLNKDGSPSHPLMLPKNLQPLVWE